MKLWSLNLTELSEQ